MFQVAVFVLALIDSSLATTVNVNPINPNDKNSKPTSYFIDAVTTITFKMSVDRFDCLQKFDNETNFGIISYAGPSKRLVVVPFIKKDGDNSVIDIQALFFDGDTNIANSVFGTITMPSTQKSDIMSLSFNANSLSVMDNSNKPLSIVEGNKIWTSVYIDNLTGPDGNAYQCIKFYQDAKVTDCGFHLSFDNEVRYTLDKTTTTITPIPTTTTTHVPTTIVTTVEPTTIITTVEPTTIITTHEPTTVPTTVEPTIIPTTIPDP